MSKWICILFIAFTACNNSYSPTQKSIIIPNKIVLITDTLLQLSNGVYLYQKQPFSGYIQSNYPNHKIQNIAAYFEGKQQNWTYSFFENGQKEAVRYYHLGEKDSLHIGWWNNGNLRFSYQFKNGNYNGWFKEYYASGKPLKQIFYVNGKDSMGKGWRENGKPFMNYISKGERRFGLMNAQLCYSLEKEKIQQ